MRSVVWRRVLAAAVVVPLVVLGGCGTDEPVVRPSSTTSAAATSPTPSPSPTLDLARLPEQPAAMAEPTTDGAIAAATYVLELLPYTFATGDSGPWRAITLDSCGLCSGVVQDVEAMVEERQHSSGYEVEISAPTATEISEDEWFSVELRVRQGPSLRLDADGQVVGRGTGGLDDEVFALAWDGSWTVHELGLAEVSPSEEGAG